MTDATIPVQRDPQTTGPDARESVPKRRRRRLKPEARRAEIIDATMLLLARKGYWGLTLADVAKEADVTVQGILHYFPTKDDLMLGVLTHRDEVDIQAVTPSDHAVDNATEFIGVIRRLVERNAERPELIRLYTVLSAESLEPAHPAHQFFADRLKRAVSAFAELAAQWHPEPEEMALQVVCALDGLQLNWLRDPQVDLVREWRVWAANYFRGFLT
jgi:AcrR family transcriptional regulator